MNACGTVLLTTVLLAVVDMRKFIPPTLPVTEVPSHVYLASLPIFVACRKKHQTLSALSDVFQVHECHKTTSLSTNFLLFYKNLILCDTDWKQTVVHFHLTELLGPTKL